MTYADNITKNTADVNYLVHYTVRDEYVATWDVTTIDGEDVYSTQWQKSWPKTIQFTLSGVVVDSTKALPSYSIYSSDFLNNNRFFLDEATQTLYGHFNVNPNDANFKAVIESTYFLSTIHCAWHVDPTDSRFPKVQYHGLITDIPSITSISSQIIFGFAPSQSLALSISDPDSVLDFTVLEQGTTNSTIEIYRMVGLFQDVNCIKCFSGFTGSINFQSDSVVNVSFFDMSIRLDGATCGYNNELSLTFPPDQANLIRKSFACGKFDRVSSICISYDATKSNTTNRYWRAGAAFYGNRQLTGAAGDFARDIDNSMVGSNTTTRSYLDSVAGFQVGDWVAVNGATVIRELTTVFDGGAGNRYVEFNIALSSAQGTFEVITKLGFRDVSIVAKSDKNEWPLQTSDISAISSTGLLDFQLSTSVESTYSIPSPIHPEDHIVKCVVDCGPGNTFTWPDYSSSSFLGAVSDSGYYQNPVQAIFSLLFMAGFENYAENYDQASFEATAAAVTENCCVATPMDNAQSAVETYRAVIGKICQTYLLKLYTKNGRWHLTYMGPMGAATRYVTRNDLIGQASYRIDGSEVAVTTIGRYSFGEVNFENDVSNDSWKQDTTTNIKSESVFGSKKTTTIDTVLSDDANTQGNVDRLGYVFSAPIGYLKLRLGLEYINIKMDDIIEVDPTDMGLPLIASKKFTVVSMTENIDSIDLELSDQRGIEENAGDW